MSPLRNGGTDKLVAESERLRRELLKTASRLDVFAGELIKEADRLKAEAAQSQQEGCTDERGNEPAGQPEGSGPGQPSDPDGSGADRRG